MKESIQHCASPPWTQHLPFLVLVFHSEPKRWYVWVLASDCFYHSSATYCCVTLEKLPSQHVSAPISK